MTTPTKIVSNFILGNHFRIGGPVKDSHKILETLLLKRRGSASLYQPESFKACVQVLERRQNPQNDVKDTFEWNATHVGRASNTKPQGPLLPLHTCVWWVYGIAGRSVCWWCDDTLDCKGDGGVWAFHPDSSYVSQPSRRNEYRGTSWRECTSPPGRTSRTKRLKCCETVVPTMLEIESVSERARRMLYRRTWQKKIAGLPPC